MKFGMFLEFSEGDFLELSRGDGSALLTMRTLAPTLCMSYRSIKKKATKRKTMPGQARSIEVI